MRACLIIGIAVLLFEAILRGSGKQATQSIASIWKTADILLPGSFLTLTEIKGADRRLVLAWRTKHVKNYDVI